MKIYTVIMAAALCAFAAQSWAQVVVSGAWVRGTAPAQKATGAFMTLQAEKDVKLVAASSPVAAVVEVHEMTMKDGVMRMRAIPSLALPAGQPVELKPGGYHIMLMELKQALVQGDSVAITLILEDSAKQRQQVSISAKVRALTAAQTNSRSDHKH
jgi:periplasmic copper chaperone A